MADTRPRVALLARPGIACEHLQAALRDAGAEVALVADPVEADPQALVAAGVQAVLVALDPSVETALERFDAVLADPAITVIFDEAELASTREGWDAARWVRHLAAKLHRHGDVFPPGGEAESEFDIETGRPGLYKAPEGDGDLSGIAGEAETLVSAVPSDSLDLAASAQAQAEKAAVAPVEGEDDAESRARFQQDIDDLQQRIAHMELADMPREAGNDAGGAVVILAGIGGPDAVRQLLGALPVGFPRAVLIQQRLDGARHDKLVRQMQRATKMPVELAEVGKPLLPGHVYIMSVDIGVATADGGASFSADASNAAFSSLPAGDTAIILLSGSDPAVVDAAMAHAGHGALVAGQSPDGCYDAAAPQALVARGAKTGGPADLAKLLVARWPA